jgi:hypothetical protein
MDWQCQRPEGQLQSGLDTGSVPAPNAVAASIKAQSLDQASGETFRRFWGSSALRLSSQIH